MPVVSKIYVFYSDFSHAVILSEVDTQIPWSCYRASVGDFCNGPVFVGESFNDLANDFSIIDCWMEKAGRIFESTGCKSYVNLISISDLKA